MLRKISIRRELAPVIIEICLKGCLKHRLSLTFTTILICSLQGDSIAPKIYEFKHSDFKSSVPIRDVWLISLRTCSTSFCPFWVVHPRECIDPSGGTQVRHRSDRCHKILIGSRRLEGVSLGLYSVNGASMADRASARLPGCVPMRAQGGVQVDGRARAVIRHWAPCATSARSETASSLSSA